MRKSLETATHATAPRNSTGGFGGGFGDGGFGGDCGDGGGDCGGGFD